MRASLRHLPLLLAFGLSACSGLPDMQRARLALDRGDYAAAERDLAPLARSGYLEAQVKLARVYAERGTAEDRANAIALYRAALRQDPLLDLTLARLLEQSREPAELAEAEALMYRAQRRGDPRALGELIGLYTDHPERDPHGNAQFLVQQAERMSMPLAEVRAAVVRWYRTAPAGAEVGIKLAERCQEALAQLPDCYVDLARYYRASGDSERLLETVADAEKAHEAGRLPQPVIERLARSLVSEDLLNDPQPEIAHRLLKKNATALSPEGQVLLARVLTDNPFLDTKAKPEETLQAAYERGSDEAALGLGRLYLDGRRVVRDPQRARRYLSEAARTLPAGHYFLGRLYERGDLGESDPAKALEHYLAAARSGDGRADLALARLYSANRGVQPDPVNAYLFATLAWRNAVPGSEELLGQLRANMELAEAQYAELLIQRELSARATPVLPAPVVAGSAAEVPMTPAARPALPGQQQEQPALPPDGGSL